MRSHRNARPVPSRLALALCALLAGASLPVWAADQPCKDSGGNLDPSLDTDVGIEYGTDNATCTPTAVAIGRKNTVYTVFNQDTGADLGSEGVAVGAYNTVHSLSLIHI